MEPSVIAVIGAPGVGKSFLVEKLAKKLKAVPILEEGKGFPERILENFKKDIRHMETILWFRNKLIQDMKRALELKKKGTLVIMDTFYLSNDLHITTMTTGFEQEILLGQASLEREFLPKPDKVLFLDASKETIVRFTLKRGRDFDTNEKFIQRNLSIKKAHDDYLKAHKSSLIYINRDDLDFENEQDVQNVVKQIENHSGFV